jgi:TonB family protein
MLTFTSRLSGFSTARSYALASLLLACVIATASSPASAKIGKRHEKAPTLYTQNDSTYKYISSVFDKLQAFWSTQAVDQRIAANSVISFVLDPKGNVIQAKLDTPPNSDQVGQKALDYVKKAGPFGELPPAVSGQNLEFKFKLSEQSLQMLSYRFNNDVQKSNTMISSASPTSSSSASIGSLFYARVVDNAEAPKNGKVDNTSPEVKATDEKVMEDYITGVRDHISQQWRPPSETQTTGPAMALLQIDRDGTLLGATLNQSSGNKEVDRTILNTIYQSVPFAPVPKEVQSLPVTMQYVFEPVVNTVYIRQNNLP